MPSGNLLSLHRAECRIRPGGRCGTYADEVTALDAYEALAAELADRGVISSPMFGKPSLKYGSKAIACLSGDAMAFKLGAGTAEHSEALALSGAALFDPSGMRPMRDWVVVPLSHAERWTPFAEAALRRLAE